MALKQIAQPAQLREHVITIELPDHKKLAPLQQLGKQVHVIDHHQYSGEDVVTLLPSSLEQFATLLDYKLNQEEYEIAINDRDFLPGLSKAGVSLERAKSLRLQELELRGQVDNMEAAKQFVSQHRRELHDLQFILAPEQYAGVMLEAIQWPTDEDYTKAAKNQYPVELKPTLILYHRAEQRDDICQIGYAGPAKHRKELSKLFADWDNDFNVWLGGGQHNCFLGAKRKNSFADVDGLVAQLLNITLHLGRPLRHYGCTFYLPLDLFLEPDLAENQKLPLSVIETETVKRHLLDTKIRILADEVDSVKGREKQAYLYFLPHLRDMIFDVKGSDNVLDIKPIEHWQLHDEMTMVLSADIKAKLPEIEVKLSNVSLYRYFNNTYLLAISVQPTIQLDSDSKLYRDETSWWHDLFFADDTKFERIASLQLRHWLHFTNQARIVYPSFIEQVFEGKITLVTLKTAQEEIAFKHEDDISPIVLFLLKRFFSNADENQLEKRLQHLPDDRMIASPAYGLAGQPLKQADIKRLFSLALYVDRDSDTFDNLDGYAYDPEFVDKLLKRDSLGRWMGLGNYSGYCGYANAYMGFGGFFNKVIAPSHVPYLYGRMLILTLFYQMALRHYNRRINHATKQLSEDGKTIEFQRLRREFIRFTNSYWFREVSGQVQGIEIFDLQTKALGLEAEYSLIKDEMERADEYSNALRSEKLNTRILWLTGAGVVLALAIATGPSIIEILKDLMGQFFSTIIAYKPG
ncbi:membrane protein [Beggiatoa sp. PS]|nr:membrane protein [Beggiatoa sp. PS]